MGLSYGGYMTSWLVTQDQRFAAAVGVAPIANWLSQHFTGNVPSFDDDFLGGSCFDPTGPHIARSPVLHARKVRTPTLLICGDQDHCTPAGQALEFYNALREAGVTAELVTYPQEGHGARSFPAMIDFAARVTAWFEEHIGR
jgi:dipeptidyl aminopeptidase/acylaminoacyl peptidase